ncbi:ATPase [Telmatobacter bradus]|uniref:F0F1 ATP synthase subunit B family protein n=1 Tax=Telmatobacter bradus TaxID=474953 RepID=UPI003B437874
MSHKRFTFRIPAFALVAVAALALTAGSCRVFAQAAGDKSTEQAKPSQEEQEHGFLVNGPIVKWASKTTGWSPETTANVFLFLNFGILVFGVGIPLSKAVPKIMRQRSLTLSKSLADARTATDEANQRLSAVEAKLAGLDAEIAKFRIQIEEESKTDEQRIKASIEEEKLRIVASTEQELNVATAQATRTLRNFAAELAIEKAAAQIKPSAEIDSALIAEFISGAVEGGKN